MTNWRPEFNPAHLYFVTTTAVQRARLFERDVVKRIVVDGLYYLYAAKRISLFAFVIMPNHIHFIIRCSDQYRLPDAIRDFKANSARLIIRQFQIENDREVLNFMTGAVSRPEKQRFKVWEDGYNAKSVFSADFLKQKMDYIHNNPIQPHWSLVENPDDYVWSSARYYLCDEPALIPLSELGVWF
jgi:putative transposase